MNINIIACLLLLCGSVFGEDMDSSRWLNPKKDPTWEVKHDADKHTFHGKKINGKDVSELTYKDSIDHPVNVFCTITPLARERKTDGKGLSVTDNNGKSYFLTLGDDYEAGIFSNQLTGKQSTDKYYDFVAADDKFKVQLNKPYEIKYKISKNFISMHIKGEGINRQFKADVDIAFPVSIKLVAQRSAALFEDVKITSINKEENDEDDRDHDAHHHNDPGGDHKDK